MNKFELDGPIPGENYTSDTKNYPWHRPPEYTNLNDAMEKAIEALSEKKTTFSMLTMISGGVTIASLTTMFLTAGIGSGKWTPDFALLMAGPVAEVIELIAEGYGIDYQVGIDEEEPITASIFQGYMEINKKKSDKVASDIGNDPEKLAGELTGGTSSISKGEEPAGFASMAEMGDM